MTRTHRLLMASLCAIGSGCGDGVNPAAPDATVVDAARADAVPPDAAPPVNLLSNGDFEQGSSYPTDWWNADTSILGHHYLREWTTEEAASGTHSVLITGPDTLADTFAYWGTSIGADRSGGSARRPTGLVLDVAIKLEGVTGEGVSIVIRGDDADGEVVAFETSQGVQQIDGTADWATYSITLEGLPDSTATILVYLLMLPNTVGTVYFDQASLTYQ